MIINIKTLLDGPVPHAARENELEIVFCYHYRQMLELSGDPKLPDGL